MAGERGLRLPGREDEFRAGVMKAIEHGQALNCPRIHLMAGIAPAGAERAELRARLREQPRLGAAQARDIDFLIEPINTRDIPGFFLNRQGRGAPDRAA